MLILVYFIYDMFVCVVCVYGSLVAPGKMKDSCALKRLV